MIQDRRPGLTLVELLILVAIVVFVVMLFIPARRNVREAAIRMQCTNNLKQIMMGVYNQAEIGIPWSRANNDPLPANRTSEFLPGCMGPGASPEDRLSWLVKLLPYVEQDALFKQLQLEKGYAGNSEVTQTRIDLFLCPGSVKAGNLPDAPVTNYVALAGIGQDAASRPAGAPGNGFMGYDRKTTVAMIRDGTANTIALLDTRTNPGPWARGGIATVRGFDPTDLPMTGEGRPFHSHPGVIQVGMADGAVRALKVDSTPQLLAALITIDGGEPLSDLD